MTMMMVMITTTTPIIKNIGENNILGLVSLRMHVVHMTVDQKRYWQQIIVTFHYVQGFCCTNNFARFQVSTALSIEVF
jgi:hypothetical protein